MAPSRRYATAEQIKLPIRRDTRQRKRAPHMVENDLGPGKDVEALVPL